ncbi:MAG: hypothetical protein AUH30_20440 [Candidatus Rokubacteria bacterium 13_1_40CM_68_15]|nr:MAG: hypothetical protein AUH30_20440 [Candidatus Rokubacteria bacterium 13_1_40CM_68_15]
MLKLAERTFREAARLARDRRSVVLLPLGAIEQHGPHLPLLVDWRGAEELARRIAPHLSRAGYRPILAPAVPYGVSTLAVNWGGTVSLSAPTLTRVIVEIVEALAHHGFRNFVFVNYQADPDHLKAMAAARRALRRRRGLGLAFAGFAPGVKTPSAMLNDRVLGLMRSRRPEREWHSGELETSLMLARQPGLVRRAVARRLRPVWVDVREGLRRGARRFEQLDRGRRGYFGSPAVARAATGNKVMALRGRLIAHEVLETLSAGRPRGRSGRSAR